MVDGIRKEREVEEGKKEGSREREEKERQRIK